MKKIKIISDIVCPWCYMSKKNVERALEISNLAHLFEIEWYPFELNPMIPEKGINRKDYITNKFGSLSQANFFYDRIKSEGSKLGIHFKFDIIQNQPNTKKIHELINLSKHYNVQGKVVESLFKAFFFGGKEFIRRKSFGLTRN